MKFVRYSLLLFSLLLDRLLQISSRQLRKQSTRKTKLKNACWTDEKLLIIKQVRIPTDRNLNPEWTRFGIEREKLSLSASFTAHFFNWPRTADAYWRTTSSALEYVIDDGRITKKKKCPKKFEKPILCSSIQCWKIWKMAYKSDINYLNFRDVEETLLASNYENRRELL